MDYRRAGQALAIPEKVREALATRASGALDARVALGSVQRARMELCPHCGGPVIDRDTKYVPLRAQLLKAAAAAVAGCSAEVWELVDAVFATENDGKTNLLARTLGYNTSGLQSCFVRRGLPTPKQMLRVALLVRFWEMAQQTVGLQKAADAVGVSSVQSMHRTVKLATGLDAREFADRPAAAVLAWALGTLKLAGERTDDRAGWRALRLPPKLSGPRLTVAQ